MSETFKIQPAPGLTVHDPESMAVLSPDGERKPMSTYWLRRLACGDCLIVDEPPKTKKAPKVEHVAPIVTPLAIEPTEERE